MGVIKIKNWEEFQHFKDRNPPWIKLYKSLLERRDIAMISDRNFRILVGFWLLASEDESRQGILPNIDDISFRLRKEKDEINQAIQELRDFLIFDDNDMISKGYQSDIGAISFARSVSVSVSDIKKNKKQKKFIKPTVEEIQAYITLKNYNVSATRFFNHYESNGWKVGKNKMVCWKSAVATWNTNESKNTDRVFYQ